MLDARLPVGSSALGLGDASLPGGIELARLVKHRHAETAVVIMATEEQEEQLFHAVKVGAAAYCPRDIDPQAMVDVIRRVDGGDFLVSDSVLARPQVTERVLRQFRELPPPPGDRPSRCSSPCHSARWRSWTTSLTGRATRTSPAS